MKASNDVLLRVDHCTMYCGSVRDHFSKRNSLNGKRLSLDGLVPNTACSVQVRGAQSIEGREMLRSWSLEGQALHHARDESEAMQ